MTHSPTGPTSIKHKFKYNIDEVLTEENVNEIVLYLYYDHYIANMDNSCLPQAQTGVWHRREIIPGHPPVTSEREGDLVFRP